MENVNSAVPVGRQQPSMCPCPAVKTNNKKISPSKLGTEWTSPPVLASSRVPPSHKQQMTPGSAVTRSVATQHADRIALHPNPRLEQPPFNERPPQVLNILRSHRPAAPRCIRLRRHHGSKSAEGGRAVEQARTRAGGVVLTSALQRKGKARALCSGQISTHQCDRQLCRPSGPNARPVWGEHQSLTPRTNPNIL